MTFLEWLSAELALVVDFVKGIADAPAVQAGKWLLGLLAVVYAIRVVIPTWRVLALSLYRDLPWSLSRSLVDLTKLGWLGISREKWYRGARLRVEWELLRPRPAPPPRHLALPRSDEGMADARARFEARKKQYVDELSMWKHELKEHLRSLTGDAGDSVVIDVEDCSHIYARADEIRNYFGVLVTDRSAQRQISNHFISCVRIKRGFIAPLHLVSGLLAECEDDWAPVIEYYGRQIAQSLPSVAKPDGTPRKFGEREAELHLQRLQTFLFDCWLLWGPSIPICTCEAWHGGRAVLQFGFGDENNSLALVFARPVDREELRRFFASDQERGDALAVKVTGAVGRIQWGPGLPPTEVNEAQQSLCDPEEERLVLETDGWPLVAAGDRHEGNARYYSAYLWSMFVICGPGFRPLYTDQTWRGILPFFEHTNIAEAQTLTTLKLQLAVKTLMTIRGLLQELPQLHLQFVCSIDESFCGCSLLAPPPTGQSMRALIQHVIATEDAFGDLRPGSGALAPRLCLDGELWRDGEYCSCHLPDLLGKYYRYVSPAVRSDVRVRSA